MENKSDKNKSVAMVPDVKTTNKVKREVEEPSYYPDISNTASATECTGMMYAPPQNQDEFESYQEMFGMQIPKNEENESYTS